MRGWFNILLFFFSFYYHAQNIVPNPSFETYTVCNWMSVDVANWTSYGGTPDYFNACANVPQPWYGVPANDPGFQNAYDGNAYGGLALYCQAFGGQNEYYGIQLTQTLSIGTKYFMTAYISRADSNWGGDMCQSNNFGFLFLKKSYSLSNPYISNNFAHVNHPAVVYDSIGWVKISGSFVADSNYTHLAIGNFYDNSNTNAVDCFMLSSVAYYYVDKVCVSIDSTECNAQTVTGIYNSNDKEAFSLYPNPAIGKLFIKYKAKKEVDELKITDIYGRTVMVQSAHKQKEVDVSELPSGVYFVEILSGAEVFRSKFLVER